MRNMMILAALGTLFAALACADTWNGRLFDATCLDQQKNQSCDPTATTVSFAINVAGKIYRFDDAGNAKAVEALRAKTQGGKETGTGANTGAAVNAKVSGTIEGEVVKVEAVQLQ